MATATCRRPQTGKLFKNKTKNNDKKNDNNLQQSTLKRQKSSKKRPTSSLGESENLHFWLIFRSDAWKGIKSHPRRPRAVARPTFGTKNRSQKLRAPLTLARREHFCRLPPPGSGLIIKDYR